METKISSGSNVGTRFVRLNPYDKCSYDALHIAQNNNLATLKKQDLMVLVPSFESPIISLRTCSSRFRYL